MDYLRGRDDKTILYPEDSEGLYHIKANEIIVLWDGANAGEFILSKNGYLGSTMAHIEVNNKVYNNEYFYYLMKSLESTSKYFKQVVQQYRILIHRFYLVDIILHQVWPSSVPLPLTSMRSVRRLTVRHPLWRSRLMHTSV